ncbi:DsbE family thiol:disulfide interchange protein [Sphingosinicella rhizophila]|uniref:DsbE family thiol:disulfide interchange protein n=1 Tax=Sphingosinicella rhizophila TaxID=3050082 RepID=A0ABU3Q314_9SPHN|nr:DsbE family thiol:disulfide interchange protein [Sphingosinicella sp. GR2756]MDT9597779.1 DsbE family thiol:disulfide interchange protein [Sphingosinicella sp. GR2756]
MKRFILWLPLAIFVIFAVTVAISLRTPADTRIHSRMIGKTLPDFALQPATSSHPGLSSADLKSGEPRLLNVFASWCLPCAVESPQLIALKQRGIPIDAIAIRDRPEDVAAFLAKYGDPFARIGSDPETEVQFALGSSGVPETFVVDGQGVIRYQHIGDIRPENLPELVAAYEDAR